MKCFATILAAVCALTAAHTQEEIDIKGAEVMEEYRKDRGHWISLNDVGMLDHMVDHIGSNGIAVAAFFITKNAHTKEKYSSTLPGEEEQASDPLFTYYKKLATDQNWLASLGLGHKTWTFGYGHDKSVAEAVGCEGVGTYAWEHVCVIVWKTSKDGTHMSTSHTTHFGQDHSKRVIPQTEDISNFIENALRNPVGQAKPEL